MVVDRGALWAILAVCCAVALGFTLRRARRTPAGMTDAVMTGLGIGIGAAGAILVAAALVARVT